MKTVGRKITSIILSLALIVGTMLIVCPPLTAMAIKENEVITRLENCKTTYVNGGVWCGTYYANNGSEGPWECFGFACEIFRMLYDCEMPRSYTGSTYNGATRYYKLVVNQYSNVTEVGSLAPGSYNSSQMRALLSQAKAGYVIQAANSRSQHTMIVNYVTDYGISVYDANSDGHNGIRSDASYSWDEFYNWRPYGVSLYKYVYYDDTPSQARIDINPNGGTAQNSFYVNYGEKCNLTIVSAWRAGYKLSGWNLYRPADGKWFVGGIGWCTDSEISANGYEKCQYAPNLSMTLDSSWYSNCSTTVSSFTFYAVWKEATYMININANGGTALTSSLSVKYNTKCNLSPDYVQRDGYELTGWNLYRPADGKWFVGGIGWCTNSEISANGYEKCQYAPKLSMTLDSSWYSNCSTTVSSFTFYAVWKKATYMVTFDLNGGECTTQQMIVTTGQTFSDCGGLPTPTRTGYMFAGWYTADGESVTDSTTVAFTENQTLYAQWVENPQHVHEYTSAVTQEPTCTQEGVKTYTCGTCGHTYTEPISALGHDYVVNVMPLTCTQDGITTHTCSRCGDSYVTDVVHATGHTYSDWMMLVDPTLTADGVMGRKCTVCGTVLDEVTVPNLAGDHVTGVALSVARVYMNRGETLTLTASVTPDTAHNKALAWSSSHPETATVTNGAVAAVAPGLAVIIAQAEDSGHKDFCVVQVNAVTPQNGAVIENGVITGLRANLNSMEDYLNLLDESMTIETNGTIGTGTKVYIMQGDTVVNEFETVLFGDVDGDGWYDGTDAYFVNLVANGMVEQSALTEAQRMAADCNHDGTVDNADASLLEQAGLLLANVDQTLPSEELQTDSVYLEYCSLIDQTVEIIEPDQPAVDQPAVDQPAQAAEPQPAAQSVWGWIKALFTIALNWLLRVF